MKLCKTLAFHAAIALLVTAPWRCAAAEPPTQVNARIEIYEFPQAMAVGWQRKFEESTEPDRQEMVFQLRTGAVGEVKIVGFGQRLCTLEKPSTVATVEQYRYPTQFENRDGFATPTAFEITNIGCTMTLKVTASAKDNSLFVETSIRDVALQSTQHYAMSKTDQPGSLEQPVFTTQTVDTSFQASSGVPRLVSVYSPYKDDKEHPVQRLVFVTIRPEP